MTRTRLQSLVAAGIVFLFSGGSVFAQETEVQFLSGHGKDDAVPWNFFCTSGANSGFWTNLPVPSQWDVKGFGTLSYRRDLTNAYDERGLYEHDFTVPQEWSGKRIFLVFDGVMTDTDAKLNGQSAGPIHQGGFYRFKYEVTSLVKFGASNKLEVNVARHSANKSVNGAERMGDYWNYSGIYRPVYLEAVPQQFIERVAVDAKADGSFAMDVFADATSADTVEAQIKTLDGKIVGDVFSEKISGEKTSLKAQINSPKLWTAETPNLYQVEVALKQDGKIIHQISQRFGFRTMEVREGDGLYVNGVKVILKGCDRHSFWPDSGRCLSEAVQRLDIETLKDMNMNAVRMSHYPPDADFLDLCDELGIYVLDELGGWHQHYDTTVGTKLVKEMVVRDVNHPCILFWDNGNEGGWNTNLDGLFAEFDPQQRHVLHPWAIHGGVNAAHYRTYEQAKIICAGDTIYMPTEFEHGLYDGGAGASLEDYWKLMMSSKICAGGFIWAFLDEGIKRPDNGQIDVSGNEAPDGIVGPYREREASFYTIKQIWSPIQILETNLPAKFGNQLSLTLENHFNFTDASQCKFIWQLRRFQNPGETDSNETVSAEGQANPPSIAPGGTGKLILNLPENFWHTVDVTEANALSLRIEDPTGRELWTYVWPLKQRDILPAGVGIAASAENFGGTNSGVIELKGNDIVAHIDAQSGELTDVERDGKKFSLSNGPRVVADGSTLKKVAWHLRDDGWLQCDYTYTAQGALADFGVAFDYPENLVQGKRWLGDGPYRVWKNRIPGTTLGVWENAYNNTITGWRGWVYPEFKGCFADVRWMQLQTAEGLITAVPSSPVFVQVLTPDQPPDKLVLKAKVSLPPAGLAFLDAIPPIGDKFHNARDNGPLGQLTTATGDYSGSVSFYFGKLP
jgi:hypothetical protein